MGVSKCVIDLCCMYVFICLSVFFCVCVCACVFDCSLLCLCVSLMAGDGGARGNDAGLSRYGGLPLPGEPPWLRLRGE